MRREPWARKYSTIRLYTKDCISGSSHAVHLPSYWLLRAWMLKKRASERAVNSNSCFHPIMGPHDRCLLLESKKPNRCGKVGTGGSVFTVLTWLPLSHVRRMSPQGNECLTRTQISNEKKTKEKKKRQGVGGVAREKRIPCPLTSTTASVWSRSRQTLLID